MFLQTRLGHSYLCSLSSPGYVCMLDIGSSVAFDRLEKANLEALSFIKHHLFSLEELRELGERHLWDRAAHSGRSAITLY